MSFLPLGYNEYAIDGEIRPNVYYYFQFIVTDVFKYGEQKIMLKGIMIFNGEKTTRQIVHSEKLKPMFLGAKYKQTLLHFVGKLFEEIIFFPTMKKLTKNSIEPSYTVKPNLEFIKTLPKEMQEPMNTIHFPKSQEEINRALHQLFLYEISAIAATIKPIYRPAYSINPQYTLPFTLSDEQQFIVKELFKLLDGKSTMCALVHGDVGCGKTIIGYIVALKVVANGFKVLFLTPTVLLASQVYEVFKGLGANCSLFTGKSKDMGGDIIIGTQALLFADFENVGLVIIDEQHKFGTLQRQSITKKYDLLMLSATPIPRTHYWAQMGKITQFHLNTRSNNLVPYVISQENRDNFIEKLMTQKEKRIVWICKTIRAAQEIFQKFFIKYMYQKFWLLHGKLKDKQEILREFGSSYGILISTTVIEVGIDLDIHIIVIDQADQFGLAQLHQLKGRAGRHSKISQCIFIGNNLEKLKLIKQNETGEKITELDLKMRGCGSAHQTNQSGEKFLFNRKVMDYKLYKHDEILKPIEVSDEIIDFFMASKSYI